MKKILTLLAILTSLLIPQVSQAAFTAVPWVATTTSPSLMQPNSFNGVILTPYAPVFIASSTSAASSFPYASTTVISSTGSVFFGTNTGTTNSFNYFFGTTSAPLQTTTGSAANIGNFLVLPKVNTANPGFIVTTMTGLQSNSASVLPAGSGPCHGWYEGSTGTGRLMAADCVQYFNPASFIGASRLNFIADSTGVTRPYWYVDQNGNAALEATTTGSLSARFTIGNINSSTQDILHCDQPVAFATSTVCAVSSTGKTGLATSTVANSLTIGGIKNALTQLFDNQSTVVANGDTVAQIKVSSADNSSLIARDNVASIDVIADGQDFVGVAAATKINFNTQNQVGVNSTKLTVANGTTGLVGISSTTPFAALSVNGKGTSTGVAVAVADSANTTLFSILDNGNTGVGTVSALSKLTLEHGAVVANSTGFRIRNTAGNSWVQDVGVPTVDESTYTIRDVTAGTYPFAITQSTGRVGIGSTSPMSQFVVSQNTITNGNVGTIQRIDSQTLGGFAVNGSGFTTTYNTNLNQWGAIGGYSNGNIGFGIWKPVIGTVLTSGSPILFFDVSSAVAIGSTSPLANFQVTNTSANATSTFEVGKSGQTKGSCEKRYRYDGTAIYISFDNNNLQQVSTVACATITGF